MNKANLDKYYWETTYKQNKTVWDIGNVSNPIKNYIDHLKNKKIDILIPGAGNAYEAEYFFNNGFENVIVLDVVEQPLINFKERITEFPEKHLVHQDFFEHINTYNLIIEHIFFCALHPSQRKNYVDKMYNLLKPKGKLVGLLFDFELTEEGPPFGGSFDEYIHLFSEKFKIKTLEKCYNSIKPRFGRELFFIFEKK